MKDLNAFSNFIYKIKILITLSKCFQSIGEVAGQAFFCDHPLKFPGHGAVCRALDGRQRGYMGQSLLQHTQLGHSTVATLLAYLFT